MRKEENYKEQSEGTLQANDQASAEAGSAFNYLKSLPSNIGRPAVESYRRGKDSDVIDYMVAENFTDNFRNVAAPFSIPVSWTLTKSALLNLLGITGHVGYQEVNGVRFYAGINGDNQLTLVAVSTMAGTGCNEDLTINEQYPYYDYADPCPTNCSNRGNLKAVGATSITVAITQ